MHPASSRSLPRIILYHQTTHNPDGTPCSILPLVTEPGISVTHLIIAAIHINEDPDALTLNDHPPSDSRFDTTWAELRLAQAHGINVLGMLGGAAKGSFTRLDRDQATFERYYAPLYDLIRDRGLNGLDLDVEEHMTLTGVIRLIDRLRADFGPEFIITLAPVAAALLDPRTNLSGFNYKDLEARRGDQIAWYNAQFYCHWGDARTPIMYSLCIQRGWAPEKVVLGLVTTPDNGDGYVPFEILRGTLPLIRRMHPNFGGVMGWEYFNGLPGGKERPWEWAQHMTAILRASHTTAQPIEAAAAQRNPIVAVDGEDEDGPEPPLPTTFDYDSDGF